MLYAEQLSKSFGGLHVLREVSFTIGDGERVGLVGPNGAGKTTILRLVAGEDEPDKGEAGCRGGTVGYLRQEAGLDPGQSLLDELWDAFPDARAIDNRLEEITVRMERGEVDLDALITEQGDLFDAFDRLDGYRIDARIGRVLDGLGFVPKDRDRPCGDFSGGWQMRIALAKVLVRRPDHLLLDEPTNHLDAATRDWLAKDLATYRGTILIAIHDGELLDSVATRILELRDGQITSYAGNYTEYQIQKAARLQQQDRTAARQEREVERQSRFIDRFGAKATKASVVKSRKKALDRIKPIERTRKEAEVSFQLTSHGRTEHDVLVMTEVSHTYGDHMVLVDVNLQVERAQKVVFVGPNGGGKTTLLRIAAGLIRPTDGSVRWAEQARLGYYDQHQDEALDSELTVLEEVRSIAQGEPDLKLRSMLGQFLFSGDDVFKTIGLLSGGERSRVALAKLVVQPTNVLVLDEPTNHLDRSTRRKLIQVLERYEGTILCAAHDRGILERVATRVYDVRDSGCEELLDFRRD